VCIANHGREEGKRYLKLLKNTRLPLPAENAPVEVFEIGVQNVQILLQPPTILSLQACGEEDGEKVVQLSPLAKRNKLMMEAEDYRYTGMSFREIAVKMELPERTVRRWVGFIKGESSLTPSPSPKERGDSSAINPALPHPSLNPSPKVEGLIPKTYPVTPLATQYSQETLPFLAAYRRFPMRDALHFFLRERNEAKKAPG
jgi:hypothetical protein